LRFYGHFIAQPYLNVIGWKGYDLMLIGDTQQGLPVSALLASPSAVLPGCGQDLSITWRCLWPAVNPSRPAFLWLVLGKEILGFMACLGEAVMSQELSRKTKKYVS
jgi:hypothetical protein